MAIFWSMTRQGYGTDGIFYQCLWVTKLCAKFGRSRIPGTANTHKSFILLRCMWKEPAPFVHPTVAVLLVIRSATVGKPKKEKKGCKQISFSHKTLCLPLPTLQKAPPAWEGCTWPGEDRHRDIFETHKYFLLCANVIKEKYLLDIYKLFFITHKCILFSV